MKNTLFIAALGLFLFNSVSAEQDFIDKDSSDAYLFLEAHNVVRQEADSTIPDLTWSNEIAKTAQSWANHLKEKKNCDLEHSTNRKYGENLAMTGGGAQTPMRAVKLWEDEKNKPYVYGKLTNEQCMGNPTVCHYTQMVWRNTREIGCGYASCGFKVVWVCNYYPKGNWLGQPPY